MKTKTIILACLLAVSTNYIAAQQKSEPEQRTTVTSQGDSIIILKGKGDLRIKVYESQPENGGQNETEIFEGVYLETVDADKRTFFDVLPFIPNKTKKNAYDPHVSGIYIGYSRMSDNFLSFGASNRPQLDLSKSWEFGFNIFASNCNFRKNPHWGMNFGLGWGYRSFSIDGNRALLKADGESVLTDGDNETSYSKSRLRHFFFRIPILLEWQQKINNRHLLFFNVGPEFEIRHGVKSFAHINGGKKQTVGKGMYTHPVGVNMLAQAGYGNLGLYLRYSTYGLFQKDKGPEVMPYSFGLAWYW